MVSPNPVFSQFLMIGTLMSEPFTMQNKFWLKKNYITRQILNQGGLNQ